MILCLLANPTSQLQFWNTSQALPPWQNPETKSWGHCWHWPLIRPLACHVASLQLSSITNKTHTWQMTIHIRSIPKSIQITTGSGNQAWKSEIKHFTIFIAQTCQTALFSFGFLGHSAFILSSTMYMTMKPEVLTQEKLPAAMLMTSSQNVYHLTFSSARNPQMGLLNLVPGIPNSQTILQLCVRKPSHCQICPDGWFFKSYYIKKLYFKKCF